ncbi:MAG: ribosome biogenesis GTPase YlqF [Oscillospiraceae bacterium]|jgi:ribosome biogenesis GTPase A|nr:ribosome biogenesis GTPase YlqF [Oscillospiraceae bacterium]
MPENQTQLNIQWFPGHMTKTLRKITEILPQIDAVCDIRDARAPGYSENSALLEVTQGRPRLIVLNKRDLADERETAAWSEHFRALGFAVLTCDSQSGRGTADFKPKLEALLSEKIAAKKLKGQTGMTLRVMVMGIPNSGKSSFINRVAGRRAAEAQDRPGVTRGGKWVTAGTGSAGIGFELYDTPGVLPPKIAPPERAEVLAFCGSVRDEVTDTEAIASRLMLFLWKNYRGNLSERYKLGENAELDELEPLRLIAERRGFLQRGGGYDAERAAVVLLDEFRAGLLGKITVQLCPSKPGRQENA